MKLVLESFQMSVGQALAHPHVPGLLRCLMAGRLMTAPLSPLMQVGGAGERGRDGGGDGRGQCPRRMQWLGVGSVVLQGQRSGIHALLLHPHSWRLLNRPWPPGRATLLPASCMLSDPSCWPCAAQDWLATQQAAVRRDGQLARQRGTPLCLPPTTPSLDQAGGLQRMAFRGHRGAVTKVLLTPSGTDAVTGGWVGACWMLRCLQE